MSDAEILGAQRTLAETSGVFAEPAAAASVAALAKLRDSGLLAPGEQVVVLVTGHGLKDVDAVLRNLRVPAAIAPTSEGLEGVAERLEGKGALN